MLSGYWLASYIAVVLLILVVLASYLGWGLSSDAQARAQAQSVRTGSLHTRYYYGGGPGFGK
ncbi:MAG: hypothetical protein NZT92_02810 [Abditibacteriales bacterium]|nr:hypothetical protein [Abditibacteriales bacterium]MDW8364802.1 hypothetical protein [Abditibacteriales bacterium]